ncbi:MAG: BlaI/MecI/CopY family transcriptional regulator, partial [Bacteroidales bacterium]|nr:BlaI/MecI/CopY family transcriptional regulator [Bacteroidales bacterium]
MGRKKLNIDDNSVTMRELTKAEEQVMQVIWSIGQGFANEIIAAYPEPKPAYNTVLSIIKILEN